MFIKTTTIETALRLATNLKRKLVVFVFILLAPLITKAQSTDPGDTLASLEAVLDSLYKEMLPMCKELIGVGQSIAGFAALWYIAARVWKSIMNAEPIDFYPLFRPFIIGFCIVNFMSTIGLLNSILQPTVEGTHKMVENSDAAIKVLLAEKEAAVKKTDTYQMYVGVTGNGDRDKWFKYTYDNQDPDDEGMWEGIGNDLKFAMDKASYNFRNSIKEWMSEVLHVLFEAASLCINTLRTFQLIVLAILGPLVFGISVFDGFGHTLSSWLARYINVFLWLPVANVFGAIIAKIQENLLKIDLTQIQQTGDTFFSSADTGYLVFMIIGIVGYFTVPSVSNFIVNAGGGGAMMSRVTSLATGGVTNAISTINTVSKGAQQSMDNYANMGKHYNEGFSGKVDPQGLTGGIGQLGGYMVGKLSGETPKREESTPGGPKM